MEEEKNSSTAIFNREFAPLEDDLFRYAYRLTSNYSLAEELVQETYLRAWRFIDTYTPNTNAKAWLFRICKNLALNYSRWKKQQPNTLNYHSWMQTPESNGSLYTTQNAEDAAISEQVMRAINSLPARMCNVVLLELENFTYQEIADICRVPINTVRTILHRARAKLAVLLGEYAQQRGYGQKVEIPLGDE